MNGSNFHFNALHIIDAMMMDNSYQSYNEMDQPLFGESNRKIKYVNIALAVITSLTVLATVISVFVHLVVSNLLLVIVIFMNGGSNILLIYWYQEGNLTPKYRTLIYFNSVVTICFCIIAMMIIFDHPTAKKS